VTRIFKRGELQQALLDALGHLGEANGYAIMQALEEHVGSGWRPSPGAIYPALLGLEDAGLIRANDRAGSRTYSLTMSGSRALADASGTLERVAERARVTPVRPTAGTVLDGFVASVAGRSRRLSAAEEVELHGILNGLRAPIEAITTGGEQ
jgi:DNA-binding PadR family transcriptional regulator